MISYIIANIMFLACIMLLSLISPLIGLIVFAYTFIFAKLMKPRSQVILSLVLGITCIAAGGPHFSFIEIYNIANQNWDILMRLHLNGYLMILKQSVFSIQQTYLNGTMSLGGVYLIIVALLTSYISIIFSKKQVSIESVPQDDDIRGITLGVDKTSREPVSVSHKELNQHALVIGTTGSGKTNTLLNIVKNCCEQSLPLIYLDGKGSIKLAKQIAKICKDHNRTLKVFSVDPNPEIPGLAKYNPLAFGNFTEWQNKIITLLGEAEGRGQEHYLIQEQNYINIVCEVLNKSGKYIDFEGFLGYINHPEELQKLANKIDPDLAMRLVKVTPKQSETSDVVKVLEMFYHSHYGHQFSTSSVDVELVINLQRSLEKNEIVLFLFDAASYKRDTSALGKLVINDINSSFSSFGHDGSRVTGYCIFDEFGSYASGNMASVLAMQRDNGLHAIVSTQSIHAIAMESAQIKRIAVELIANCNTFVIHKINDPYDITLLSDTIGKQQVFKTVSISHAEDEKIRVNNVLAQEYILDGAIIRSLAPGEAYLCRTTMAATPPKLIEVSYDANNDA